jgi:hypothetical protein
MSLNLVSITFHMFTGTITDDPGARMQWVYYWRNVVRRYLVLIHGWPARFPFKNLSNSGSIGDLEDLLRMWRTGKIYWRKLSDEEFRKMDEQRDNDIEAGNIIEPKRRGRSDFGKRRARNREAVRSSG